METKTGFIKSLIFGTFPVSNVPLFASSARTDKALRGMVVVASALPVEILIKIFNITTRVPRITVSVSTSNQQT